MVYCIADLPACEHSAIGDFGLPLVKLSITLMRVMMLAAVGIVIDLVTVLLVR